MNFVSNSRTQQVGVFLFCIFLFECYRQYLNSVQEKIQWLKCGSRGSRSCKKVELSFLRQRVLRTKLLQVFIWGIFIYIYIPQTIALTNAQVSMVPSCACKSDRRASLIFVVVIFLLVYFVGYCSIYLSWCCEGLQAEGPYAANIKPALEFSNCGDKGLLIPKS